MKAKKETAALLFTLAAKHKIFAEKEGATDLAKTTYQNILKRAQAQSIVEIEERGKAFFNKQFEEGFGSDWWELIRVQYPITEENLKFVVRSEAKGWNEEKIWEFDTMWQAYEKVSRLVAWVADNRKRGFGDTDADVDRLTKKKNKILNLE